MADVNITTSLKGVEEAAKQLGALGDSAKKLGDNFVGAGKTMTKWVTGPLVAVGAGAIKLANEFETASNKIAVSTGKSGAQLVQLENIAKGVFKQVPGNLQNISSIVGELNTRTGESGATLFNMTKQIAELSRITGTNGTQIAKQFSQAISVMRVLIVTGKQLTND